MWRLIQTHLKMDLEDLVRSTSFWMFLHIRSHNKLQNEYKVLLVKADLVSFLFAIAVSLVITACLWTRLYSYHSNVT